MRRVVITGLGAISPHGLGAPAFWNALLEGKSSVASLTRFDPASFASRVAGAIPPFKTTEFVPKSYRKATKIMARDIELAVLAADFAVRDAKLATKGVLEASGDKLLAEGFTRPDPARVGCNIGAGLICADLDELTQAMVQAKNPDGSFSLAKWGRSEDPGKTSGMDNLTPLWLLKYLPNMLACHVSIIHDTQGPSNTITCGQASAGLALAEACRTIQRGAADLALVGGCESKLHPMGLLRWSLLGRLTTASNDNPSAACRPLDATAAGTVLAEGGAVLVIEELERARQRSAHNLRRSRRAGLFRERGGRYGSGRFRRSARRRAEQGPARIRRRPPRRATRGSPGQRHPRLRPERRAGHPSGLRAGVPRRGRPAPRRHRRLRRGQPGARPRRCGPRPARADPAARRQLSPSDR